MAGKAKPVPEGFHTLTPHLTVRDADKAIDSLQPDSGTGIVLPASGRPARESSRKRKHGSRCSFFLQ